MNTTLLKDGQMDDATFNGAGKPDQQLGGWARQLVEAVNRDNERPGVRCRDTETLRLLRQAPVAVAAHAVLAIVDFARAGNADLDRFRSDEVGHKFVIHDDPSLFNLLVGRLSVPGGPWPGHYGLEAAVFTAYLATMPGWFPPIAMPYPLHFADAISLSGSFQRGQGSVVFPELLSVSWPVAEQSFGLVFIDKLTHLYESTVVPALERAGIRSGLSRLQHEVPFRTLRELAFLAHEWGHLSSVSPYGLELNGLHRRLGAAIGELEADIAAIVMLLHLQARLADPVAEVLVLDRIVREAWLPRAATQVNSIAARQLLLVLGRLGALVIRHENVILTLQDGQERLEKELRHVRMLVQEVTHGNAEPALAYLGADGWSVEHGRYRVVLDDPIAVLLRPATLKHC